MKRLLACIILLANPLKAQVSENCAIIDCPTNFTPSPGAPSIAGRQKVETALIAVRDAEANEAAASGDLKARIDAVRANLVKSIRADSYRLIPNWLAERLVTPDKVREAALSDREYLLKQEILRTAIAENYKAHNDAILEASRAFHLFPPVMDFTGDPRAAGVNMVAKPWLPRYSRHEKRDEKTGLWRKRSETELAAERLNNSVVGGGVTAAQTLGNGVMEFYGQAFASPEDLAILIYHETSHWVDTAGRSGGFTRKDPPSISFRSEQHAYERAADFARKIGADPGPHVRQAEQYKLQAEISEEKHLTKAQILTDPRFRNWIGKNWEGSLAIAPTEPELSSGDEALLRTKMAEAKRLVEEAKEAARIAEEQERFQNALRKQMDDQRRFREAEDVQRRSSQPASPAAPAIARIPFRHMLPGVKSFAEASCLAPGRVPLIPDITRSLEYIGFDRSDDQTADRLSAGLEGCERLLFRRLIEVIRAGKGPWITDRWMFDTATFYGTPVVPDQSPAGAPPSRERPRDPVCSEENGVRGCPR